MITNEAMDIPYYMPEKAPVLTPEQQRRLYKVGDIVIVRPDAFEYFDDVDRLDMSKFFGRKVEIIKIESGRDIYTQDMLRSYPNTKLDDLYITVKSADESFPNTDHWYWLYRCLYSPKTKVPSYKPRKIIRKLDESIQLDRLPDVPPLLTPNQQLQQYKLGDMVYIRPDAFNYFYDVNPDMEKWLGKFGEIVYITVVKDFYMVTDRGEGMELDDLLLTLRLEGSSEDSDTYYWFYRCLINMEYFKPSYKPKNIIRSIEESFRSDYDISPEKYQEKYGTNLPSVISIEDIEKFYNVKFENYCNDLYPELNESLINQSKFYLNFKDRKEQLSRGKYSFIIFDIKGGERLDVHNYLKNIEIISNLDAISYNFNFVFLTEPLAHLDAFHLYNYAGIRDIRKYTHEEFHLSMDKISPVMTFDELKIYMDRTLICSAKDMYAPKKNKRSI